MANTYHITAGSTISQAQTVVTGAVAGDTVIIDPGTYTWDVTLDVTKNIKLLGGAGNITSPPGVMPKIIAGAGNKIIHYTCENSSGFTAEIGNLELFGHGMAGKLWVDGCSTITQSGTTYSGGISIHDIRFTVDPTFGNVGAPPQLGGQYFLLQGWVFGVMWHCEIEEDVGKSGNECQTFNHDGPPPLGTTNGGTGDNGAYSRFELPANGAPIIDSLEQFTCEDNIWHHGGACTDSTGAWGGAARMLCRHNTHWGMLANHGTRDTSGPRSGGRSVHHYNNHFVRYNSSTVTNYAAQSAAAARDGEVVCINNFITVQAGGSFNNSTANWCAPGGGLPDVTTTVRHNYDLADGLNPLDDNMKGDFDDPLGPAGNTHHSVYDTYSFTGPIDPSILASPTHSVVVNGVDTSDTSATTGQVGSCFSDVYGTVTGGTYTGLTITGAVISGKGFTSSTSVAGYFDGFILRNRSTVRTSITAPYYSFVEKTTGTAGNATLVMSPPRPNLNNPGFAYDPTGIFELRKVRNYWSQPGQGPTTVRFAVTPDTQTARLVDGTLRWVEGTPGGIWLIGNMRRVGTGAWQSEAVINRALPGGRWYHVHRDSGHLLNGGFANTYPSATQPIRAGYPWDKTYGAGNPSAFADCKVGADWTNAHVTAVPEFASFYIQGAVRSTNIPYPHPLRQPPVNAAPTSITPISNTFATGVAEDVTVTTNGTPPATIAVVGATPLPTGVTLIQSSPVDNTVIIRASSSTTTGTTGVTLRATNSVGHVDQAFTVGIFNPNVTLTGPADGAVFNQPATVQLTAKANSVNGIEKVEFYRVPTLPTLPVLLGTDTTADPITGEYVFVWSGMADGTYVLKATAYDALGPSLDSSTVTITVQTDSVIPPPAPAQINVRG